ncbi:MAG TPA: ABC transporter ATP-binding protein [Actinophytocola sp.]|uniref:ABC transporter ATP-binding protein n=1 Tax=Actinophytocola sp. TaxID=1872138 RepID=UPI002DBB5A74|nr:ABC transporter ATP-binding protein [Actinophytocola sp.]HEU5475886.1 ABC transporter ATP-binding protein [Actinophytocola sp.]
MEHRERERTIEHGRLPTATPRRTRAVVAGLLRRHRGLTAAAVATMMAATASGLVAAPVLGHIVDLVAGGGEAGGLVGPVLLLVGVALAHGILATLGVALVARLGEGVLAGLREVFVERALGLPLDQVERAGSGDLTSRVTNDVTVIGTAVREALPEFVRAVLIIGLTLVGLAVLDWRFMVAALVAAPVQLWTVHWYARRAGPLYATQRVAAGDLQHQLLGTIGGAPTVRALRLTAEHRDRVTARSADTVELTMRGIRLQTRFFARLNLAELIGLAAVLVVGFLLVRSGAATIGAATAAALYFHGLFNPVNTALALVDDAQAASASLARLVGVVDLPAAPTPERTATPVDGAVKVVDLAHEYVPGHEVLHGVHIDIAPGERVALVGASGAGKSTVAKLVAGVHRATRGSVSLGGVDLAELAAGEVRRTVVLITQEVHVFAGTLAEDLRLARPGASDEELRAALERVHADWVTALPDGLTTVVGAGGHRLTVAQAQQLALARLVLADPPVAILDEATAEAGSAGARELEAAAERALAGRTGVVVAHRLTQAAAADRVVVLEAGRVVETGPHAELVAAGGRYAVLWRAWASGRLTD